MEQLDDVLMTPLQLAVALDVSRSTVYRWMRDGGLPFVRTAGSHRRRIKIDDAVDWLRALDAAEAAA